LLIKHKAGIEVGNQQVFQLLGNAYKQHVASDHNC